MQKISLFFLVIFAVIFTNSCNNSGSRNYAESEVVADAAIATPMSNNDAEILLSSASETTKDSSKKIIKTADLDFKSKDVVKATYAIERLAKSNGGFVASSQITKNQENEKTVQTGRDSALKIIHYVLRSNLSLRVPQENLDTTLTQIADYIDYLNSRNITAEDASIKYLQQKIAQERANLSQDRIDSLQRKKQGNLEDNIYAEDARYNRQLNADAARLQQMQLDEKVNFSTINLSIYEDEKEYKSTVPYVKNIRSYKSDFDVRFVNSIKTGWNIFLEFILVIVSLWWLIILIIVLIIAIKKLRKKKTKI